MMIKAGKRTIKQIATRATSYHVRKNTIRKGKWVPSSIKNSTIHLLSSMQARRIPTSANRSPWKIFKSLSTRN
jgi:hypothetical protein